MLTTRFAFLIVALLAAANASAQETYRWVEQKSGQTIFSDQPPPPGAKQVLKMNGKEQANDQQMPYATRQAAEKFPVTLYTAANCMEACKQARELLNGRGNDLAQAFVSKIDGHPPQRILLGDDGKEIAHDH